MQRSPDYELALLWMRFGITLAVVALAGAALWAGKLDAAAAVGLIGGLVGAWLPGVQPRRADPTAPTASVQMTPWAAARQDPRPGGPPSAPSQ